MKHAATKAAKVSSYMRRSDASAQAVALSPEVMERINEVAPQTRRAMRQAARAAERRNFIVGSASLAALVGTAASVMAFANPLEKSMPLADGETTTTTQIKRASDEGTAAANRSTFRASLVDADEDGNEQPQASTDTTTDEGSWSMGDANSTLDTNQMSRSLANNPAVAKLMDQDQGILPDGFNPNHATTDVGNAYPFSQCTWWAYVRRHQLGLPVGSHFGNGAQWAGSARAAGYWVDNTPRHVGDIMVFKRGQEGASGIYGHVAIVEAINPDGSVTTSECGAAYHGSTFSRTFTNVNDFEYIHY